MSSPPNYEDIFRRQSSGTEINSDSGKSGDGGDGGDGGDLFRKLSYTFHSCNCLGKNFFPSKINYISYAQTILNESR